MNRYAKINMIFYRLILNDPINMSTCELFSKELAKDAVFYGNG